MEHAQTIDANANGPQMRSKEARKKSHVTSESSQNLPHIRPPTPEKPLDGFDDDNSSDEGAVSDSLVNSRPPPEIKGAF